MRGSVCLQGEILSLETFSTPKTLKKKPTHEFGSETINTNPLQIHHSPGSVRGQLLGVYPDVDGSISRFDRRK